MVEIEELTSEDDLKRLSQAEVALIYKHSPVCGLSAFARSQIERFVEMGLGVPVYQVDVIAQRELSDSVAERLGIPHESPQAILLRCGQPVWRTSHSGVRAAAITSALDTA